MTNPATVTLITDFLLKFPAKSLDYFESQTLETQRDFIAQMTPEQCTVLLRRLNSDMSARLVANIVDLPKVMTALDPAIIARFLNRMNKADGAAVLEKIPPSLRQEITELTNYPPDSAGFLMETKVTLFHPRDSVARAIEKIKSFRGRNLSSIFLVDIDGALKGRVYLQDIITADAQQLLADLAKNTPYVTEMTPKDEIIEVVEKSRLSSIPIVDSKNVVLGAIYHERLINMAHQESLDGLQTMVGVSKEEKALSAPLFAVRKRLPWLTVNLLTTFVAAFVVGMFEDTIAKITALAVLLPVVAGQSGNTGAQSLAVTMRGLALREIRLRHKWQVILKEGTVGAVNGVAVGLMCAVSVWFWSGSGALALVIGTAMILAMVAASLSGAATPMILTAIGQDPATSSSIILTTITDIVGFLSFLGLASLFGHYLI